MLLAECILVLLVFAFLLCSCTHGVAIELALHLVLPNSRKQIPVREEVPTKRSSRSLLEWAAWRPASIIQMSAGRRRQIFPRSRKSERTKSQRNSSCTFVAPLSPLLLASVVDPSENALFALGLVDSIPFKAVEPQLRRQSRVQLAKHLPLAVGSTARKIR